MLALIVVSLAVALAAPPALAASGNGLYEPYPAASQPGGPAASYYAQLGVAITPGRAKRGNFSGLRPSTARGPSERAGATRVGAGWGALIAVGLLALLAGGAAALVARRRPARMEPC